VTQRVLYWTCLALPVRSAHIMHPYRDVSHSNFPIGSVKGYRRLCSLQASYSERTAHERQDRTHLHSLRPSGQHCPFHSAKTVNCIVRQQWLHFRASNHQSRQAKGHSRFVPPDYSVAKILRWAGELSARLEEMLRSPDNHLHIVPRRNRTYQQRTQNPTPEHNPR
jgi:hypothetical protein